MAASVSRTAGLVVVCLLVISATASARPRHARVVVVPEESSPASVAGSPLGTVYPYAQSYVPFVHSGYAVPTRADMRVEVTPEQAQVYVDGYFAGLAFDFDGPLNRLYTTPGRHAVTLYLDGYRTTTEKVDLMAGETCIIHEAMAPLPPDEASAPVPSPEELQAFPQ